MKALPLLAAVLLAQSAAAEPLLSSWLTEASSRYARIYASEADRRAGRTSTTWTNFRLSQSLPAYCGVQEISSSPEWVYVRTTGLGLHVMGPWFDDASRTRPFINLPVNQKRVFRIPRHPEVASEPAPVRGDIGFFVDGVHAFDSSDAVSYSHERGRDGEPPGRPGGLVGDRLWNRDAYVNEAVTFDAALAHQQNTGDYHYHANPVAPRYLLGDHVEFDAAAGVYCESKTPLARHSPIVGWARDGFPIYGPYGYSQPMDPASGLRRMASGYALRDGRNGTVSLTVAGRRTLPAWAARLLHRSAALGQQEMGPNVSSAFPLGRYLEDNEYLGDVGRQQGKDFDLDEHNGRRCVTPEFPEGTYAYFVTITADGTPVFPYNVGRSYYGVPRGGQVPGLNEEVTAVFRGGAEMVEKLTTKTTGTGETTLVWSSVEGGTYRVEAGDATRTVAIAAAVPARAGATQTSVSAPRGVAETASYRVTRTALAPYDSAARTDGRGGGGGGIVRVSPDRARPGSNVTVSIQLDPAAHPPPPHAPVLRANVGALEAGRKVHVSRTEVTAELTIPADARPGALPVSVTFPGPPDNPRDEVTYSLARGFIVEGAR